MNYHETCQYNQLVDEVNAAKQIVANYKLSAQANQRGFQRLHRKIAARDLEIAERDLFIMHNQLTNTFVRSQQIIAVKRKLEYEKKQAEAAEQENNEQENTGN